MSLGIGHKNMDPTGFPALVREIIQFPLAQDANYFSAATAGGAQGNFSVAASVAGDSVFLSLEAAKPLYYARCPQATMTDASGSDLLVSVRITGKRFGRVVIQDIACVTSGTAVSGTRVIDEVTGVRIKSISGNTTSDVLVVGFDDSWIGLKQPCQKRTDFNMSHKIATVTPASTGPQTKADLTAAMFNKVDAAIDFKALHSAAIAVTDTYHVEYFSSGGPDGVARNGKRLG